MRRYYPTSPLFPPVENRIKNVYSWGKQGGINGGDLPTASTLARQFTTRPVHKPQVIRLIVQVFTPQLSAPKIDRSHLLKTDLYTQSTPPINKKKKGKLERNT